MSLPDHVRAEVERILNGKARRLLAERSTIEPINANGRLAGRPLGSQEAKRVHPTPARTTEI